MGVYNVHDFYRGFCKDAKSCVFTRSYVFTVMYVVFVFLAGLNGMIFANPLIEQSPFGTINWEKGVIQVKSGASPLKLLQTLRVDNQTLLGVMMLYDANLTETLSDYSKHQGPDLPLYGKDSIEERVSGLYFNPEYRTPSSSKTVVLIDAQHLGFYPCLFPEFYDDAGRPLLESFENRQSIRYFNSWESAHSYFKKHPQKKIKAMAAKKPFYGRLILKRDTIPQHVLKTAVIGVIL
jgi:hypothetical protein